MFYELQKVYNSVKMMKENVSSDITITPTVRIVMVSDTHNQHNDLEMPPGDVLIHAGDFTSYGNKDHAISFNEWLGEQTYQHKIVVNGNHENNASWKLQTPIIISEGSFLRQTELVITLNITAGHCRQLKVFGMEFCWPTRGNNPCYDAIPIDTNILVTHSPVYGYVDGEKGCSSLLEKCNELAKYGHLQLVVCGHIHYAYGICQGQGKLANVQFVNASACDNSRTASHEPLVIDLPLRST